MTDERREVGALAARVDALAEAFEDFRAESRRTSERIETASQKAFEKLEVMILETVHTRFADHSRRLGALERYRAWVAGGLAAIAAISGLSAVLAWLRTWPKA